MAHAELSVLGEAYLEAGLSDTQMFPALLGDVYLKHIFSAAKVGNFLFQSCLVYFSLKRVLVGFFMTSVCPRVCLEIVTSNWGDSLKTGSAFTAY